MGVSVTAYGGLKLMKLGGDLEDAWNNDFEEGNYVHLAPPAGQWQSEDLQTGTYSYLGKFEARIGSYGYFDDFRKEITRLVSPVQDGVTPTAFKELLEGSDTYLLLGPRAVAELEDSLSSADGVEIEKEFQKLHFDDFYQTFMALKDAVKEAHFTWEGEELFGVVLIS